MSVVRRVLPLPEPGEARFLSDLLRSEPVGGLLALTAAVVAVVWANSPWDASYQSMVGWQLGPLDLEHWGADGALTLFFFVAGPRAEAGVRGRVATASRGCGRAGGRGPMRGRRTGGALPRGQRDRAGRAPGRLGDPRGDRHRLRARGPGRGGLAPAGGPACVPADAGGRRRPGRDRDHRGGVLRRGAPGRSRRRPRARGRLGGPAAAARPRLAPLSGHRRGRLVVHARERGACDHRGRAPGPAQPGTSRRRRGALTGRADGAPAGPALRRRSPYPCSPWCRRACRCTAVGRWPATRSCSVCSPGSSSASRSESSPGRSWSRASPAPS